MQHKAVASLAEEELSSVGQSSLFFWSRPGCDNSFQKQGDIGRGHSENCVDQKVIERKCFWKCKKYLDVLDHDAVLA